MLLIDKPGTGRSISRDQAGDVQTFAQACEHGFSHEPSGQIIYAISVVVDGNLHGAVFKNPGETAYHESSVAEGIMMLYAGLGQDGIIGPRNLIQRSSSTLTGNPLADITQVADALMRPDEAATQAIEKRFVATHQIDEVTQ